MTYRIPGFSLDLPEGTEDHSVLAFTLTPDEGQVFSIVVTRSPLPDGSGLTDYVSEAITTRETNGEGYALSWKKPYLHEGVEGFITAGTLESADSRADERRLYLLAGKTVLVMIALAQGMFTQSQLDALNGFIKGFHPDKTGENV